MTLLNPLVLQNSGSPVTYSASDFRHLNAAIFGTQGRVCGVTDLAVTQRGAGANMSVDIAPGHVLVPGIDGPYICPSTDIENRAIEAAPGLGDERYDLIYAVAEDPQAVGSGPGPGWEIKVLKGTESGSPVVPSLPSYSTRLATVHLTHTTTSILNANIDDTRVHASLVPYANAFSLPAHGFDGQIAPTAAGNVFVFNSGAFHQLTRMDYASAAADRPADLTPVTTVQTYGSVVIPNPGVKSRVCANLQTVAASTTTNSLPGVEIRISFDAGVTWISSARAQALSATTLDQVALSPTFLEVDTPSDDIWVQGRVICTVAAAGYINGYLGVTVDPST